MLDELVSEEQELLSALKAVRAKREATLAAQAEQAALEAQLRHEAHMQQVASLQPVRVLGVTYDSLRKYRKATSVRFVPVHADIKALLSAALPSKSEEQFSELCTALVSKLMGYSVSHEAMEAIEALRESSGTARYFDNELHNAVVVMTCEGRLSSIKHAMLSDMLTAWALAWGQATSYEEEKE